MIFLSDLHLGDGGPADNFGPPGGVAESALAARIELWQARKERVGIAGDLLELLKFSQKEVLKAHGSLIEQLLGLADFYVAGNHDEELQGQKFMGLRVEPYVVFDLGSGITDLRAAGRAGDRGSASIPRPPPPAPCRIYCEHGHRHDPLLRRWRRTSEAIVKVSAWAEEHVNPDIDLWADRLVSWIGGTGRHGDNERYTPYIVSWARAYRCNVAVFGHTHWVMNFRRFGRVRVYNTGTWINGRRDYVHI